MEEFNPRISVVLAHYNRKNLLLKTLKSIETSEHVDDIEVVIVDDVSSEEHRLDDIVNNYDFKINLINQRAEDKNYVNPCVPYNIGFKEAKADVILIQNPECYHVGDVISHALSNIKDDNYIAYATYALNKRDTEELGSKQIKLTSQISKGSQQEGWYNHSTINPRPLHFASCITKKNLTELGGFDEAYANGIGFDDDEFLLRIRQKGLDVQICDSPLVLHQNHYNEESYEHQSSRNPDLLKRNADIYNAFARKVYKPKVVGFSQLHNELQLGNLRNWFKTMSVCDEIYIFDQNSTDGSKEVYEKHDNVHVIYSDTNRFEEELLCKQELLEKLLKEQPDADWILWLDGDTLLDARLTREALEDVLFSLDGLGVESGWMGHYNLWRSDVWHRVDDEYDHFMKAGRMALWKNTGHLKFNTEKGLHKSQHPSGLRNAVRLPYNLIHRGFADDDQIIKKYENYKSRGQSGWALDRLLNESTLTVERVPDAEIPIWIKEDKTNPKAKKPLKDVYESR